MADLPLIEVEVADRARGDVVGVAVDGGVVGERIVVAAGAPGPVSIGRASPAAPPC
jgi:hypothetical protein